MEGYELGKDIQEIKDRLECIESRLDLSSQGTQASGSTSSTYGDRTYLVLNPLGIDLWIQVTGDVHTGNWGPNQVNNGEGPELKSRKIDFGNAATYHIKVWKNNAGSQGTYVGEFDAQVRYNAAGNRDSLQLSVVTRHGETYLLAFSVREALEVALILWGA